MDQQAQGQQQGQCKGSVHGQDCRQAVATGIGDNRCMSEANASPAPTTLAKSDQNLVWIDCEMTGLDPEKERLLEIAVVVTGPHLSPRMEGPVLVIHQASSP